MCALHVNQRLFGHLPLVSSMLMKFVHEIRMHLYFQMHTYLISGMFEHLLQCSTIRFDCTAYLTTQNGNKIFDDWCILQFVTITMNSRGSRSEVRIEVLQQYSYFHIFFMISFQLWSICNEISFHRHHMHVAHPHEWNRMKIPETHFHLYILSAHE